MPSTSWKTSFQPDPDREYLALLTFLPLKHYRTIPRFVGYSRRIQAQLAETVGLVGCLITISPPTGRRYGRRFELISWNGWRIASLTVNEWLLLPGSGHLSRATTV